MRKSFLEHLRCPSLPRCGGALELGKGEVPLREVGHDEVLEGTVVCMSCGQWYPVLGGLLILVANPLRYLTQRVAGLSMFTAARADFSPEVLAWLDSRHISRSETRRVPDAVDSDAVLHYESLKDLLADAPLPEGFAEFLSSWEGRTPFDLLAGMAEKHRTEAADSGMRIAVDAGCGAGGLVARLARSHDRVFGVDLSFSSSLMARSILLRQPKSYVHYVKSESTVFERKDLSDRKKSNVEILVADCMNLPFRESTIDTVASANVLDVVHPRRPLREAARVLKRRSLLLLTDPFKFLVGGQALRTKDPLEETSQYLASLGFDVLEEHNSVPWLWYRFNRHLQIYLNYCGAFRSSGGRSGTPERALLRGAGASIERSDHGNT